MDFVLCYCVAGNSPAWLVVCFTNCKFVMHVVTCRYGFRSYAVDCSDRHVGPTGARAHMQ
jgi:hypothetical protein